MAASRALFPGPALEAHFRDIIATEPAIDAGTRDRLAEKCARPVARMWVTSASAVAAPAVEAPVPHSVVAPPPPVPNERPHADPAPNWSTEGDRSDTTGQGLEDIAPWPEDALDDAEPAPVASQPAFDPFAFSVVALLKREGRTGLAQRLAGITAQADLVAMAEAQHLALPDGVAGPDAIRTAMIDSAEARLAGRRAAAS